jgi:hypothetical protein
MLPPWTGGGFEALKNANPQTTITIYTETVPFTEETFGECFQKVAIVKSNGNVRLEVKVANSVH